MYSHKYVFLPHKCLTILLFKIKIKENFYSQNNTSLYIPYNVLKIFTYKHIMNKNYSITVISLGILDEVQFPIPINVHSIIKKF